MGRPAVANPLQHMDMVACHATTPYQTQSYLTHCCLLHSVIGAADSFCPTQVFPAGIFGRVWNNLLSMDWVVAILQSATRGVGTEALPQLLRAVAEKAHAWNALILKRAASPAVVLVQAPHESVLLPPTLCYDTTDWQQAEGYAWRVIALPVAELYYALRIPPKRTKELIWEVVCQLTMLLGRHERFHREINHLRRLSERQLAAVANLYENALHISNGQLEPFLQTATRRAVQAMDAQACSLMLLDPETKTLRIAASYGLPKELVPEVCVPIGEGVAGRVAQTGEPMLITDPRLEPSLRGVQRRAEISGSICVPLRNRQNEIFGVMTLRRLHPNPPFETEDLRLFTIFASQVALAIENARLYERLYRNIQQLTTLVDLTQVVTAVLDLDTLFQIVSRQISEQLGFSRMALFLQKEGSRYYAPRLVIGYRPETFPSRGFRKGHGVIGIVAKKRIPLVVQDARHEIQPMHGFGRAIGANRYCVLPIIMHGNCIGVLLVDNADQGSQFAPEQVELLAAFVNQVGIAIENARLYKEMENRYREIQSLAAFRNHILSSLGSGMFTLDRDGRVSNWNRKAEEITRVSLRAVRGKHYTELVEQMGLDSDKRARLAEAIEQVLRGEGARSLYKVPLHNGGGARILNFTLTPLIAERQTMQGAVGIFEDITEYLRMEARLSEMERLATVGQMTATIAHEIRNPLTALKGAVDLLPREEVPQPLQIYLEVIQEEVYRLAEIAEEFLEFARPFRIERQPIELRPVAQRALRAFATALKDAPYQFVCTVPPNLTAYADPSRLEQALRNLIQNAIQAMPDGGTITVSTVETEHTIEIRVSDTGPGIPPEQRERIFTPFFTTRTRGTGLGLSIVQKIAEGHDGRIRVECPLEGGSIFTIELPKIDTRSSAE